MFVQGGKHLSSQLCESTDGRIMAGLGTKGDTILKTINIKKRSGGVAQVVEHLASKLEVLSSKPRTALPNLLLIISCTIGKCQKLSGFS
jgi:hypothetical protein